jgi:hypothetical protein
MDEENAMVAEKNPFGIPKLQHDGEKWTSDKPTEGGIDPTKGELLSFQLANAKLKALRKAAAKELELPVSRVKIFTLTLPAGWSCPGANECLAFADPTSGRIWDSPTLKFRCFAASAERYENVRNVVWHNFNLLRRLKDEDGMATLILDSLYETMKRFKVKPDDVVIVRIHVGGDFYSRDYVTAWNRALKVLELGSLVSPNWKLPKVIGYAYTKSLHHLDNPQPKLSDNFVITGSEGGRFDHLIPVLKGLKVAKVVGSIEEAESEGLEIDHDDSHALFGKESFALLIHGTQPKGSASAKALSALRSQGIQSGYAS